MEARNDVTVRHVSNIVRLLAIGHEELWHSVKVAELERLRSVMTRRTFLAADCFAILEVVHALEGAVRTILTTSMIVFGLTATTAAAGNHLRIRQSSSIGMRSRADLRLSPLILSHALIIGAFTILDDHVLLGARHALEARGNTLRSKCRERVLRTVFALASVSFKVI